jgi:hypothetical protein
VRITTNKIIDTLGGTANTATLAGCAWSTVSDWRKMKRIPDGKLVLLAYPMEVTTAGKIGRKELFPTTWSQIWPELRSDK